MCVCLTPVRFRSRRTSGESGHWCGGSRTCPRTCALSRPWSCTEGPRRCWPRTTARRHSAPQLLKTSSRGRSHRQLHTNTGISVQKVQPNTEPETVALLPDAEKMSEAQVLSFVDSVGHHPVGTRRDSEPCPIDSKVTDSSTQLASLKGAVLPPFGHFSQVFLFFLKSLWTLSFFSQFHCLSSAGTHTRDVFIVFNFKETWWNYYNWSSGWRYFQYVALFFKLFSNTVVGTSTICATKQSCLCYIYFFFLQFFFKRINIVNI